jgi:formylglycine-generating enzyme required for sulfatase activity
MRFHVLLLGALLVLAPGSALGAVAFHRASMSMEVFGNAVEGGRGPRCDASGEVAMGKKKEWWIALGDVRPDSQGGWQPVDSMIRCGAGPSEAPPASSGGSASTPYLVATVSATAAVSSDSTLIAEKLVRVDIALSVRKVAGFGAKGEPRYEQSMDKRTFFFVEHGSFILPLLVSNRTESDAFKLHEALVSIKVERAGAEGAAAFGAVEVSSDLDGADLLLDGGVVGTVSAGKETVLRNVLAGDREISVRDASGRQVTRVVRVEPQRTVLVALNLPDPAREGASYRLTPLGKNAQGYEEYRRAKDGAVVVRVPAGEFVMGDPGAEGNPAEHKVYVSEFLMDKNLVDWEQFKKFAGATGTTLPPHPPYWGIHDDQPAVFVTWKEAKAYCEWAGARLATEAEFEKAARGTDGRTHPWGNEDPTPERAVYRRNWGYVATAPVGTHPAGVSPYGLLDMAGNVWEFVADWYDHEYYKVSPSRDPKGPPTGRAHVVRGGSWDSRPAVMWSAVRNWAYRGYREGDFGFRCAMDPPE